MTAPAVQDAPEIAHRDRLALMIVEDNPADSYLLRERIQRSNTAVKVVVARSVHDAATVLRAHCVDLIVLDLNLPDSRGVDTVTRMREFAPTCPLIAVSGHMDDDLAEKLLAAGATQALSKGESNPRAFIHSVLYCVEQVRLAQEHQGLRRILETTPDAILVLGSTGAIRYVNRAALELFGVDREAFVGELFSFSVREGETTEVTVPRRSGARICEMRVVGMHWLGESAVLATLRDVTAIRHAQQEASARASLLSAVLNAIDDAVVVADRDGRVLLRNSAAHDLFGPSLIEGASALDPAFEIFSDGDEGSPLPSDAHPFRRAQLEVAVDRHTLFAPAREDEPHQWLSASSHPWLDLAGETRGTVTVLRNITGERGMQTQLMMSDRMASVGMLAAAVAHEVNSPLAAILANLEYVQEELAPGLEDESPPFDGALQDAVDATGRVREIVRDLKLFSRHEDDTVHAVDLHEALESTARMAWGEIRHRAKLERDYGDPTLVAGTESRLGQVFLNILVNAAQAIPPGNANDNVIRISTRPGPTGLIEVEISDSGPGIPPDVLPRLFTPFFTTKAKGVGTGLGLMICERIVTMLGGRIHVASTVGKGTSFRIWLPVAETDSTPKVAPVTVPPAARRGQILLVEDDDLMASAIVRTLSPEHDVTREPGGRGAAARLARGEHFDLILCDLMMPDMSGQELHGVLKSRGSAHADTMIFLTGGAFTPKGHAFLTRVDNPSLDKPFTRSDLRVLVNKALDSATPGSEDWAP